MSKTLILKDLHIYHEDGLKKNASLVIKDRIISDIISNPDLKKIPNAKIIDFPEDASVVPGFIDLHVHGANGNDVMDATAEALKNISYTLAKEGTTGFLATTMTAPAEQIEKTLCAVNDFLHHDEAELGAKILGVHLEGPFLSPQKIGAQPSRSIISPNMEYINHWQKIANNVIKLVTLAPELPGALELIKYLKNNGIIASIGHTDATYEETQAAIQAGCSHATHLFNAMRNIHQREPGVITALLLSERVTAELILDGIHLHPAIAQLALKLKGTDKIILVTDAMRAKCLKDGCYDLGGQEVIVKNNTARLATGTLAGSVLKMNSALKNLLNFTGCSLSEAIQMTSENPAKLLGIFDRKGSIALNKDADLVVLDKELNVLLTLREGKIIYQGLVEKMSQ